jgi:hypothetical protein
MEIRGETNTIEGITYTDTLEKLEKHVTEVFTEEDDAEAIVVIHAHAKIKTRTVYDKTEAEELELIHHMAPASQVLTRDDFDMLKEKDKELSRGVCDECGHDSFQQGQGAKICESCGAVQ